MIVATGIDIIEVRRVAALLQRGGDRFLRRWFTDDEVEACRSRARPAEHFAARLAAKEALVKALRTHWTGGLLLREVSVVADSSGAPTLRLAGRAAELAREAGITGIAVSLSHTAEYAVASVVASRDDRPAQQSGETHATPP
jgi:holo-[acyl-carrier protein] synthase